MRNNLLLENFFGGILASVPNGAHRSGDCKEISADVIAQYDRWLRENVLEAATPDNEAEDVRDMLVTILQAYTGWLLNRGHIGPEAATRQVVLQRLVQRMQLTS